MTTFVAHLHHTLSSKVGLPSTVVSPGTPGLPSHSRQALRTYFLELNPPKSIQTSQESVKRVQNLQKSAEFVPSSDGEEEALWAAIAAKLAVGIYTQFLEVYLDEANEAETELEWWGDIERSRWRTTYFLLQSMLAFPILSLRF